MEGLIWNLESLSDDLSHLGISVQYFVAQQSRSPFAMGMGRYILDSFQRRVSIGPVDFYH